MSSPAAGSNDGAENEQIPKIFIPRAALKQQPAPVGKQVISIRIPPVKKIPPPPNTVILADLLGKSVQKIYGMLENMLDLLPKTSPSEKKRILLLNLSMVKEILMKLYLLAQDVDYFPKLLAAMNSCQEIESFDSKAFQIANELYAVYLQAHKVPLPAFQVGRAFEVLIGLPNLLPSCIWQRTDEQVEREEFVRFLTQKMRIKAVPLQVALKKQHLGFSLRIERGILYLAFEGAFEVELTFDFVANRWILLHVGFPFLKLHQIFEFAPFLNAPTSGNCSDYLEQISQILTCIFSFACQLRVNLLVSQLGSQPFASLPVKCPFWSTGAGAEFGDFFVEFSLAEQDAGNSFFSGCTSPIPCIQVRCSALMQEETQTFVSIQQDLFPVWAQFKAKAISQRLSQIQFFLPELFQVHSLPEAAASILIITPYSSHLVYIDDVSGRFRTCQNGKEAANSNAKVAEFSDPNGLTEYLFDCFLHQVAKQILDLLAFELEEPAFVAAPLRVQIHAKERIAVQVTRQGIQILANNTGELLHDFESFSFDVNVFSTVALAFEEQRNIQALEKAFASYSEQLEPFVQLQIIQGTLLACKVLRFTEHISTLHSFRPGFKCAQNEEFVFDLEVFEGGFVRIFDLLLTFFSFASFMKEQLPKVQWKGSAIGVQIEAFHCASVGIVFDWEFVKAGEYFTIDGQAVENCFNSLFALYLRMRDWKMLFQVLEFRFNLLDTVSTRILSSLFPSFGECINLCFFSRANNCNIQLSLKPTGTSTFLLLPNSTHQWLDSICKQHFKLTEFDSLFDLLAKWAEATEKFARIKKALLQALGPEKLKLSKAGNSLEFSFSAFQGAFSIGIPSFRISFIQNLLTDKFAAAFCKIIDDEVAQQPAQNIAAVMFSLLNLLRTSHAFIRDFCRIAVLSSTSPKIIVRCPFVLVGEAAKRAATPQNAIAFNSSAKTVTLALQMQQKIGEMQIYSMLLVYSLERNICSVLPLEEGEREWTLRLKRIFEDYTSKCDQGTIQLYNYVCQAIGQE